MSRAGRKAKAPGTRKALWRAMVAQPRGIARPTAAMDRRRSRRGTVRGRTSRKIPVGSVAGATTDRHVRAQCSRIPMLPRLASNQRPRNLRRPKILYHNSARRRTAPRIAMPLQKNRQRRSVTRRGRTNIRPESGVPGDEQSSRHKDDDDASSFWLVNDRNHPNMCGLWWAW